MTDLTLEVVTDPTGFVIAILGGLIGLGGAEFRLPVLIGVFALAARRAVPLNLLVSLVTVALTTLSVVLLFTAGGHAIQAPRVFYGTWTATATPDRVFHGTWSAQTVPESPNTASGSWALLMEGNRTILEGTWSAAKSSRGWEGAWSARVGAGKLPSGQVTFGERLSGTWQAGSGDIDGHTFADLLRQSVASQITGTWRSRGLSGSWSLMGSPR